MPVTLPNRLARMYLDMFGDWYLPTLAGITTAPVLEPDGTVRTVEGYDSRTQLWCANVPPLRMPERPTRAEAGAGLRLLRETFRTFPFSDAPRRKDEALGVEVVNLDQHPGIDESTFLVGLVTAICRPICGSRPTCRSGRRKSRVQGPGRVCSCARSPPSPSPYTRAPSPKAATAKNWTSGWHRN